MPPKRVTMTDIAKAAGVSQSTVSNILGRNRASSFPQETVTRVLTTAEKLGYQPQHRQSKANILASRRILVLATRLTNPYYPSILQSIEREAHKNGLHVVCGDTYHRPELEKDYLDMALDMNFLAVIYLFPPDNPQALERALKHLPIITICDNMPDSKADQVELNNYRSGCIAAEHLLSLGHQSIAVLSTPMDRSLARLSRVQGAQNLISASDSGTLHIISDLVDTTEEALAAEKNFDYAVGYHLAQDPNLVKCGATAIIAVNDMVAIGAIDTLLEKGFRVPEDYSIIGFDNLFHTGLERISLTTVDPHADMLAQSAMDVLLHRLNIRTPNSLVSNMRFKAECQPRLIVRKSTAPPKGRGEGK